MPDSQRRPLIRAANWTIGIGLFCALVVLLPGCQQGASKPLVQVSENDFDKLVLKSKQPVLVDFSATWCGPCREMEPVLGELAAEMEGRAAVVQVDVDKAKRLANKYDISGIPCFIVFKDGKPVGRSDGLTSKQQLANMLKAHQ
jgi:thioredoxin 1